MAEVWKLLIALAVLAVVILFLIRPQIWKLTLFGRERHLPFDFTTVPILGVLVLLITTTLSPSDAWTAIVGSDKFKPYAIIILFFSLAYTSISLDCTGVFNFIAIKTVIATEGKGQRLFFAFFALSSIITVATSNDIVILTITPIICAIALFAQVNPIPLLFAQFFAANIWSMAIFIGNPTNIIVAQAEQITFVGYSSWLIFPTVACGFTALAILFGLFKAQLPEKVNIPPMDPWEKFADPKGAVFAGIWFLLCIILLAISNWLPVPIWAITLFFALVQLAKDVVVDLIHRNNVHYLIGNETTNPDHILNHSVAEPSTPANPTRTQPAAFPDKSPSAPTRDDIVLDDGIDNIDESDRNSDTDVELGIETPEAKGEAPVPTSPYRSIQVAKRLPWAIVPFVVGVFIIVEALSVVGFTTIVAEALVHIISSSNSQTSQSFIAAIFVGLLSSLSCQVLNNQPMTILFTRILQEPAFTSQITGAPRSAAMFALIMGSNIGGNMTLVGALAGIMWSAILKAKGVNVTAGQFARYGFLTNVPVILVGAFLLGLEFALFGSSLSHPGA